MLGAASDTKKLDDNMNKLQKTIDKTGKTMSSLKNVFLGSVVGGALVSFGSEVIDSLKNYEYFSASLRTLMYGDKQTAKALEGQLISLAARTPFSLVDVQDGTKQLLAYGFEAGNVVKNMEMLGDISSGVGKPLSELVYLYGTLKTQGRAFTKDINQFTTAGINLLPQLAKQFKTTESNVMKLVEAGKVGFKDVEKAFKSMTSSGGQFFGMMAEQAKTTGGQISMLGDSWEQLKVNIGKSQGGIINGTVTFLNQMTSALSKYFADANMMQENFAKNGAKQFGFWAKALHETIGVITGYNYGYSPVVAQENFQGELSKLANPKDLQTAYRNKAEIYRQSILKDEELKSGKIDRETADRFQATVKGSLNLLEGNIKLLKNAPINQALVKSGLENIDRNTGSAATSSIGSATEVHSPRQNINITLDRLGDVTINGTTMKEDAAEVRSIWSKQLLEVLNDANLVAGR